MRLSFPSSEASLGRGLFYIDLVYEGLLLSDLPFPRITLGYRQTKGELVAVPNSSTRIGVRFVG